MKKRMFHLILGIAVVICFSSLTIFAQRGGRGMGQRPGRRMGPQSVGMRGWETILVSQGISQELAMNTIDPMWSQVQGISTQVMPMMTPELRGTFNTVELKSLHNKSHIYIYARWSDPTPSVYKKMWMKTGNVWQQSSEDEDRIAFMWDINQTLSSYDFSEQNRPGQGHMGSGMMGGRGMMGRGNRGPGMGRQGMMMGGCALLCHADPRNATKLTMSTSGVGGGIVDLWHWKSARTNPAGFADDQYIDPETRKNDSGTAVYVENIMADGTIPAFMFPGGTGTSPFLFGSEAIPFDDALFREGDRLPAYVLSLPSGDRASVETYGVWKNGYWTVILKRSLGNGSGTDVQFTSDTDYFFAIAIFNNAGDEMHLKSQTIGLKLEM
jgi:hypothetical protein